MKLAIFAFVIFILGLAPGLGRYAGPPPEARSRPAQLSQDRPDDHPKVLFKLSQRLQVRL